MNLPHPLNRPYQKQTARRILDSDKQYIIVSAPTGSGKTAYAGYAASKGLKTLACVRTKSLQAQYADGYGFYSITGKTDYDCLQVDIWDENEIYTSDDFYSDNHMSESDMFSAITKGLTSDLCTITGLKNRQLKAICTKNCPYPIERDRFIRSRAGIMNYAKFLSDKNLIAEFSPNILFLDEAHELADNIVTDFSGTVFKWKSKRLRQYIDPVIIDTPQPIAIRQGREWLEQFYNNLKADKPKHPRRGGDRKLFKWWERRLEEVDICLACIAIDGWCWFVRADEEGFTCKPLTSQFHFRSLFEKCQKIVLMSATIQRADVAALGIEDYEFIKVPSAIPAPMRPVVDMKAPAYTAKMTYQEKREHARIISEVFRERKGWNGIIHTTSEKMAYELADMMRLPNPIWLPTKGDSTVKSYQEWQAFNDRYDNAVCISWQFFAGADMGDVAINISARTPYPYFGDEYEKARFNYHPGQARVRVANILEQQMGRNRRGFAEHYGPGAKKYCGICDGKWLRLRSALQKDFLDSII